ncbi:MAG: S-methyl-5-thioribose-1-phosphate isomerase [Verrucomicrobiae bacterium]|nr:S-methyl-5-thioribose-1-phosphate isomerase [Verrucomicrobiae bacterium]
MLNLLKPIEWKNNRLILLDQTLLPCRIKYLSLRTSAQVWEAIKVLRVRGAPAIGVAAAFGMYLGLQNCKAKMSWNAFRRAAQQQGDYLNSSRPTAVNLRWAVERQLALIDRMREQSVPRILAALLKEARRIIVEDMEVCKAIGRHGLPLLRQGCAVLTHCNAGGLATTRYGTALAPVYAAVEKGRRISVYSDETRPLLQGSRLTACELKRAGVPVTVICDNMAATVMAQGKIDVVIVGADRIVANGDFANKIGTYGLAILAREHGIPFYCAAPASTVDLRLKHGSQIPIEERKPEEITHGFGRQTAPTGVNVFNPAFDVTPHRYVSGFITEKGILKPPFAKSLKACCSPII